MCAQAQFKLKRNTVRRQLLRAISLLLRFHSGNAERNRIFADVRFASENDTREVHLTPLEIARLLQAYDDLGYPEIGLVVRVALQTSADRGTLLHGKANGKVRRGFLKRDVQIFYNDKTDGFRGEIFPLDTKTLNRSWILPITDFLCRELLALCKNKEPDDQVINFSYAQLDFKWKRIRKKAGFWSQDTGYAHRFKDLRAQPSIYGEEAGIPQTVLSKAYGHSSDTMINR